MPKFIKDYPLGNKKKGDEIDFKGGKIPRHLNEYFKETAHEAKLKVTYKGDIPTDKNTKDEITKFLHANGVNDTNGLNKEDLLMMTQQFYTTED